MNSDAYMAKLRKLCEQYGHEWRSAGDGIATVMCDDCHQFGDVVNVRSEE